MKCAFCHHCHRHQIDCQPFLLRQTLNFLAQFLCFSSFLLGFSAVSLFASWPSCLHALNVGNNHSTIDSTISPRRAHRSSRRAPLHMQANTKYRMYRKKCILQHFLVIFGLCWSLHSRCLCVYIGKRRHNTHCVLHRVRKREITHDTEHTYTHFERM